MRAGSLSNPRVQRLINREFIAAELNTEGERSAGSSFAHKPSDAEPSCIRGNGKQNVQILAMTPRGEIFHVISGYISGPDLLDELNFALNIYRKIMATPDLEAREILLESEHKRARKEIEARRPPETDRNDPRTLLGSFARRRQIQDHRFVEKNPLLKIESFRPESLVGNGTTFFGSSRGGLPSGTIGDADRMNPIRKFLEELENK